jgi:betaine reductase
MTSVAQAIGANRILRAGRIPHPVGDPTKDPGPELVWRRHVIETALAALAAPIEKQTIFDLRSTERMPNGIR